MKGNLIPGTKRYEQVRPGLTFLFRGTVALLLGGALTSCLAQQADLDRFQKEFEVKLAKMDQQMNRAKKESEGVLNQQRGELKELVKARAQIKSELRSLKEENLTRLSGKLEMSAHRLEQMNSRADDLSAKIAGLGQQMQTHNAEQETKMTDLEKRFDKALVQQQTKVTNQLTGFQQSLQGFKEALGGVDTRLEEERQRATSAEAVLQKEFKTNQETLLTNQKALQSKLESDTQALKGYLEQDVKTSVDSVTKAVTEVNMALGSRIQAQETISSEMKTEVANLKATGESQHKHLEGLTKSVTTLRDVMGKSGREFGGRLADQSTQLDEAKAGVKQVQEQLAGLSTKVSTDNEALRGYLEKDVRTSLASIVKALDEEKLQTSQELRRMDTEFQSLKQSTDIDLEEMRKLVEGQDVQVQELGGSVKSFRDVLNTITDQLGKRSDEQLQIVGQLTARMDRLEKDQSTAGGRQQQETQTITSHLAELTSSIQSTQQGLEQVKATLSAQLQEQMGRIDDHERRLADTGADVEGLDSLRQGVQDNAAHLNQVTDSLSQLKEAFSTIGTKLGERVDAHEAQLTTLSQQVQGLTKK